jgi:hypothetical protein
MSKALMSLIMINVLSSLLESPPKQKLPRFRFPGDPANLTCPTHPKSPDTLLTLLILPTMPTLQNQISLSLLTALTLSAFPLL